MKKEDFNKLLLREDVYICRNSERNLLGLYKISIPGGCKVIRYIRNYDEIIDELDLYKKKYDIANYAGNIRFSRNQNNFKIFYKEIQLICLERKESNWRSLFFIDFEKAMTLLMKKDLKEIVFENKLKISELKKEIKNFYKYLYASNYYPDNLT